MLVEPPPELPREVEAEYARMDRDLMRKQSRHAAGAMCTILATLPVFAFIHVTSWPIILAMFAMAALSIAILWRASRQDRPVVWSLVLTQPPVLVLMARMLSPFLVVPVVASVMAVGWFSFPVRLDRPWRPIVFVSIAPIVALAIELSGVASRTWHIGDQSVGFTSAAFDLGSGASQALLVASLFLGPIMAGMFSRRLALERRSAMRVAELQAWHLRKLVRR